MIRPPAKVQPPPGAKAKNAPNTLEDFWARIEFEPMSGCWIWIGHRDRGGYGKFSYQGKFQVAHRFAWRMLKGEFDATLELDRRLVCKDGHPLPPYVPGVVRKCVPCQKARSHKHYVAHKAARAAAVTS